MALDMEFVRSQFPGLGTDWALMDNAGGSQILKGVVDKITQYYYSNNVQTGGSYDLSQQAAISMANGRENIATMFNATRPEEIVFGASSTVLLQVLSRAMAAQFEPDDEIIVTIIDHESNIGPWVSLQEKGVKIVFWPMNTETQQLELTTLDKIMTDKTRLVCCTHVSNVLGTINPIKDIAEFVHQRGARICVDGVAYAPHRAVDVQAWNVDFYVLSLYKTYGPHHAALFIKYEHMPDLSNLSHYFYDKDKIPAKLEPGNANYELSFGSGGIVDYLAELGLRAGETGSRRKQLEAAFELIAVQEFALTERLLGYLRGRNDCTIFGIPDGKSQNRVATISFVVEGHDPEQVCQKLDEYKIALRFGDFHARRLVDSMGFSEANGILRVSMTHYNTLAEVDRVIAALDQVLA